MFGLKEINFLIEERTKLVMKDVATSVDPRNPL